ncbi:thiol-disulfide oxidoreductase DCC family protein [Stackebrandtia soli]|uniref:thiol-disulfide oxidoreductase DCC family protein n=1 Tax=Stackebrandtia soli TaxID=1892856 RepID=UPI0039EA5F0C
MTDRALFLFDGDCAFCSRSADVARRVAGPGVTIEAWQWVDLSVNGLTVADVDAAVWWLPAVGRRASGPDAIAALLRTSPHKVLRIVGSVLSWRPVSALAWPVYRLVARNRHRLPGGTPTCSLPHSQRG